MKRPVRKWLGKNIVRGYKYNGDYVILDDEDFKKASPKSPS
jgi:non-homologous end joining protein Ku